MISDPIPVDIRGISHSLFNAKLEGVKESARPGGLLRASQDFESYFLSYMMKVMRETVPKGELTANRMGEMYYSFYDEEISKRAAQAGGIGLSSYVLEAVTRNEGIPGSPVSALSFMKS